MIMNHQTTNSEGFEAFRFTGHASKQKENAVKSLINPFFADFRVDERIAVATPEGDMREIYDYLIVQVFEILSLLFVCS